MSSARVFAAAFAVIICATGERAVAQSEPVQAPTPPAGVAEASTHERMPTFGSVVHDLGEDVLHLPSVANALWLAGGGTTALVVHHWDDEITGDAPEKGADSDGLGGGSIGGGGAVQGGVAVGTFLIGKVAHNARVAVLGAELVRAQVINAGLTGALKVAVQRERPDGGHYSFPSGHTSASFATATVLGEEFGWRAGVPANVFAAYVAASRVHDRQHYASDVVFGAAIGIVSGRTVMVGHGHHAFRVDPVLTSGGAAVMLTHVASR
jgi:hypothetical protein